MENQQMGEERLDQYLNFIKETELLKNVLRTAWGSTGRQESTAEHSWRLALFAALLLGDYPELDGKRVLFMGTLFSSFYLVLSIFTPAIFTFTSITESPVIFSIADFTRS